MVLFDPPEVAASAANRLEMFFRPVQDAQGAIENDYVLDLGLKKKRCVGKKTEADTAYHIA